MNNIKNYININNNITMILSDQIVVIMIIIMIIMINIVKVILIAL